MLTIIEEQRQKERQNIEEERTQSLYWLDRSKNKNTKKVKKRGKEQEGRALHSCGHVLTGSLLVIVGEEVVQVVLAVVIGLLLARRRILIQLLDLGHGGRRNSG